MNNKRDKFDIELDEDTKVVLPMRYQILNAMRVGKTTISSRVGKKFNITPRKALDHMTILQKEKYMTSVKKPVKFPTGFVAPARVFTKLKDFEE